MERQIADSCSLSFILSPKMREKGGEGISKKAFSSIAFAKHNIEDPRANISEEAKFVVVGDSKIVIPAFVRKIEELSNEKNLIFSE